MSLLFRAAYHPALRAGRIRVTYRRWKRAKVVAGRVYHVAGVGALAVDDVADVPIARVSDAAARLAGFPDRAALIEELDVDRDARVFRVRFHLTTQSRPRPPTSADLDGDGVAALHARLAKMDRLSGHGPWTRATLRLIARHPHTAASRLAPQVGRDTPTFKADVRKLKRLGLTESHEVGYELTPRGAQVVAAWRS